MKIKFIINGHIFTTAEQVADYLIENGYRISNTTTVKTKKGLRILYDVTSIPCNTVLAY